MAAKPNPKTSLPPLCGDGIALDAYRIEANLTWRDLVTLIGAHSRRQAAAWACGEERPPAIKVRDIHVATQGRVTPCAMHARRLAWEEARARRSPAEPIHSPRAPLRSPASPRRSPGRG